MDSEPDTIYTFVALRNDGVSPVVELRHHEEDAQAFAAAIRWLGGHRSADRVQVWRSDLLIGEFPEPALPAGPAPHR